MFCEVRFIYLVALVCLNILITSCSLSGENKNNFKAITFELKADSSAIVLKGLEHNIIESLQNDTLTSGEWESLFSVYVKPAGADESLSQPLKGIYSISGNTITFQPDSSFIKGHTYDAVFIYPQYYGTSSMLKKNSLPGKLATIENHFDF